MGWMIGRTEDAREVSALIDSKTKFFESMQDLGMIKTLTVDDYSKLGIPFGLGKRISCNVKSFMKQ